jgi:hypothetical protein
MNKRGRLENRHCLTIHEERETKKKGDYRMSADEGLHTTSKFAGAFNERLLADSTTDGVPGPFHLERAAAVARST